MRLYIDSRDRAGSRCANIGELKAGKDSSFVNGNSDPRSLQIFAWSKKTKLTIPNKDPFAGLIYAPNSKVKFSGKGKLTGGVAGQKVEIRKDMIVQSSALLNSYTIPSLVCLAGDRLAPVPVHLRPAHRSVPRGQVLRP